MTTPNTTANGGQIPQWHQRTDKMDDKSIIAAMKAEIADLRSVVDHLDGELDRLLAPLAAVSVDAPLSAEIEAEAKAFEATLPHVAMRWGSILYPWGWRYANDAVQEQFKAWCNRRAAPAPVSGMPDLARAMRKELNALDRELASTGYAEFGIMRTRVGTLIESLRLLVPDTSNPTGETK
jgi:hypothetical protein